MKSDSLSKISTYEPMLLKRCLYIMALIILILYLLQAGQCPMSVF